MGSKNSRIKSVVMVYSIIEAMTGGAFSQALERELSRGMKPTKLREPCDTCENNRKDCEAICRGASKELYPGCDIRIRTCNAYRKAQEG